MLNYFFDGHLDRLISSLTIEICRFRRDLFECSVLSTARTVMPFQERKVAAEVVRLSFRGELHSERRHFQ